MRTKHTLTLFFESKGMKLRTWAISRGLSKEDILCLYDLACGKTQGERGKSKELKELLIKEGFRKGFKKVEKNGGRDGTRELKKGA